MNRRKKPLKAKSGETLKPIMCLLRMVARLFIKKKTKFNNFKDFFFTLHSNNV